MATTTFHESDSAVELLVTFVVAVLTVVVTIATLGVVVVSM